MRTESSNNKKKAVRKIVTERLRRYYAALTREVQAGSEDLLNRALEKITARQNQGGITDVRA
jgi:hypothetical protein